MTTSKSVTGEAQGRRLIAAGATLIVVAAVIFVDAVVREPDYAAFPDATTAGGWLSGITSLLLAVTGLITTVTGVVKVLRPTRKGKHAK